MWRDMAVSILLLVVVFGYSGIFDLCGQEPPSVLRSETLDPPAKLCAGKIIAIEMHSGFHMVGYSIVYGFNRTFIILLQKLCILAADCVTYLWASIDSTGSPC
jgi:hypothetical protein